ncbi:MAG: 2-amino-4-hydroxy-6-hydroxymethyldihydropteridine diphosphokinase [Candidatus Cybelea sp.]
MSVHTVYVGIGANAGDRTGNLSRALDELPNLGTLVAISSTYRTAPWGRLDQTEFLNVVASLRTELSPHDVLDALLAIERRLGRTAGERWGPRVIDLDLLLYDDLTISDERLRVPHEHLAERAFVLVPLAELDDRFAAMRDALPDSELAGVVRVEREGGTMMSPENSSAISERVRALADFLSSGDAVRVRIVRGDDEIEVGRRQPQADRTRRANDRAVADATRLRFDTIKADLVGIFHLSRPAPSEGETFDADRELGYIEALGIRTPVHSMGAGRLVRIAATDESPVEYGQALFSIARG